VFTICHEIVLGGGKEGELKNLCARLWWLRGKEGGGGTGLEAKFGRFPYLEVTGGEKEKEIYFGNS